MDSAQPNTSNRRKQSKPNRLENASTNSSSTQYHVAAEQQDLRIPEDECDRISLNCEDGSLTSSNDEAIGNLNDNSIDRTRGLSSGKRSRSGKRKPLNGNNQSSTRVFHPDAFCSICRKEFCNKYFLKTHLANKHGIFDQQSVLPSTEISDSTLEHPFAVISTLTNDTNEFPSSDIVENHADNEELESLRVQMNEVIAGDEENTETNGNEDDEQDGSTSHQLILLPEQISSILSNENNNLLHPKIDDDQRILPSQSPSIPNNSSKILEDFCEICQKHFCNKYYLRKHKLDVHGVQTDGNIKTYKRIDNNLSSTKNSSIQQSLGLLLNPIFSSNKRRYTDSSNDSSDIANVLVNQLTNSNGKSQISTCTLCGKKFQSSEYLQLHLMNKHQIKTDIQQRTTKIHPFNPTLTNTYKKIKLEPNETSMVEVQKSPTVMPGIVDTYFAAKMADRVSCDICHKQVCNKYFLKTHKLKVHGVSPMNNNVTIEDEGDQQPLTEHSPPQLLVDEISTEPGVIPSPDALTASVNTFIGNNQDSNEQLSTIACDLCSKSYPSKFLLHIHTSNVHGIQQASSVTNGTATTTTNKNQLISTTTKKPLTNGNSSARSKQTPQVQLRVTCQVCKKELCNKYFLRAHMRNVHNITIDDVRLIQPSNSTSPTTDQHSNKPISNLLSPSSTIATDTEPNSLKHSLSNDNGHPTDTEELENIESNKTSLLSMQPFLVESDDDLYKDLFVPCMVYLPCRHRVTKPLEVSLRLKPVDNSSSNNAD